MMKSIRTTLMAGLFLLMILATANPVRVLAATPACTTITNTASVSYSVANAAQSASGSVSFFVGNKVDVLVTTMDTNFVLAPPNALASSLTFSVTNNGNAAQKYTLTVISKPTGSTAPFGGADNFDATNVRIFVGGVQTNTIASLASGASISVTISADIPSSQHDGDIAAYALKAQTGNIDNSPLNQGTGAIVGGAAVCTGDIVFGDAAGTDDSARDGAHSSQDAFKVLAAELTITKTETALYDPVHCASLTPVIVCTGSPRNIPGALVEYTIVVSNSATGTASSMNVSDMVAADLDFYADGYGTGKGLQVTAPNINGGATTDLTNIADGDAGSFDSGTGTMIVRGLTVQKNQSATVKFKAFIK